MTRSSRQRPVVRKASPQRSIVVEVTKDGPDSSVVLIGKITIERGSDYTKLAAEFAEMHALSPPQTNRLHQQVANAFNTYLN